MRLDYNILCIDDEIDTLTETKWSLAAHNEKVGIRTNFRDVAVKPRARETEPDAYKERIFSEINAAFEATQFDLIMVDLHLGPIDSPMGFKGHEIIRYIRDTQTMYRPIVFYSSGDPKSDETAVNQLEQDIKDNQLVGRSVFLSARGNTLNRHLNGICSEMHKEEHKLNATRGLLMDRTSEIDAKILAYLRQAETWKNSDPDIQKKIQKIVEKELRRLWKNAVKGACEKRAQFRAGFEAFVTWISESPEIDVAYGMDAFSRNNLIRELMRISDATKEAGDIHSTYFKGDRTPPHLNSIRNIYAHQTEENIGGEHNEERCKYIREEVRRHLVNIDTVTSTK